MDLSELFSAHRGIISEKITERKVWASISMPYLVPFQPRTIRSMQNIPCACTTQLIPTPLDKGRMQTPTVGVC